MATKEKIKKLRELLGHISKSDYSAESTYLNFYGGDNQYHEMTELRAYLLREKLIFNVDKSDYHVKLTNTGEFALKYGITTYSILNVISVIFLKVIPIAISVLALYFSYNGVGSKTVKQSYDRENKSNNIQNSVYNDSVFIEKIKYSIKHDSLFLNELKIKLKEKQLNNKITTP